MTTEQAITIFTAIGFIVSVVLAGLFALAYFKSKVGNATIAQQSELIKALTERVDLLAEQRVELTKEVGEQRQKIQELETRNKYLETVVTGKQELDLLVSEMAAHRAEVRSLHSERDGKLSSILAGITLLKEGLIDVNVTPITSEHSRTSGN